MAFLPDSGKNTRMHRESFSPGKTVPSSLSETNVIRTSFSYKPRFSPGARLRDAKESPAHLPVPSTSVKRVWLRLSGSSRMPTSRLWRPPVRIAFQRLCPRRASAGAPVRHGLQPVGVIAWRLSASAGFSLASRSEDSSITPLVRSHTRLFSLRFFKRELCEHSVEKRRRQTFSVKTRFSS